MPELRCVARPSARKILKRIGESESLLSYANGRLPETARVIRSVTASDPSIADSEVDAGVASSCFTGNSGAHQHHSKPEPMNVDQMALSGRKVSGGAISLLKGGGRTADWAARDAAFVRVIENAAPQIPAEQLASPARILKAVGIKPHFLLTAKGRIPKTAEYLASLVVPFDIIREKRLTLKHLMRDNPGLGREQLRLLDRVTVEYLCTNDREFFESAMPPKLRISCIADHPRENDKA